MGLTLRYIYGQTPIDEDEKEGLLIKTISTKVELDEFEQQNIEEAELWAWSQALGSERILSEKFIFDLHRKMFGNVWQWAGTIRKTNKNIGADKAQVAMLLRQLLDDAKFWIANKTYAEDEVALRVKHRIVHIHCFPNGNGRHSRLLADVIVKHIFKKEVFSWGGNILGSESEVRQQYLDALHEADSGNYQALINFARPKVNNRRMKNFVEELRWRGMIQDMMPGVAEQLDKEMTSAYVGIDPTADSLHIGHLVSVMMLRHFQCCGHRPIVVVGGATGMIGDPSMKSAERNLLDEATLRHNQECIKKQLAKFLDFDSNSPNAAKLVNNYDWTKDYTFLSFIRDIGKHITVNYMMAKDSVKKRLSGDASTGMSFTEFSYQLLQAYDFQFLYEHENCKLQMGGSDQWGNITTGTELIRRTTGGEAFALVCPLITKADGGKFGKTESGNVWLDPERTSPYAFYQFWLNVSDADAEKYIKIFTSLTQSDIAALAEEQAAAPHLRPLQKALAKAVTCMVHSEAEYDKAEEASQILFGNATSDSLRKLDEQTFLAVFDGVPMFDITASALPQNVVELLSVTTRVFPSKGECRKMIQGGGVSVNKDKVPDTEFQVTAGMLINRKYLLVQKGRKNYFILRANA